MELSNISQRTKALIGENALEKLAASTVAVIGVGGVGGICAEALARAGIGHLILVDKDVVEESNINRQIVANMDTIGHVKVDVLKEKIEKINPKCKVDALYAFYDQNLDETLLSLNPDFIIDCIDSLKSKKDLMLFCIHNQIPFLISTGMARKMDPSRIKIMELEKTSYDPLAKQLRIFKRKNKIREKIYVAASDEPPVDIKPGDPLPSMIFVPATAGLLLASECVARVVNS